MGRVNNTCLACTRKKQKCDRQRPSCHGCIISKVQCMYSDNASFPKPVRKKAVTAREIALEERLNQLEQAFVASKTNSSWFVPFNFDIKEPNDILNGKLNIRLSEGTDLEAEVAEAQSLEFLAKHSFMSPEALEEARTTSVMFRYTLRGHGFHNQGKLDLAIKCMEKSVEYFAEALANSSVINVRAILGMAMLHLRLDKLKQGFAYYTFAANMAKDIGINKEETLSIICDNEIEKEECRKLWWWIYNIDQFLRYKNKSVLKDEDNGIFLPGNTYAATIQDKNAYLGMYIMASSDWFTPSLPDQTLHACRILLTRIFGKVLHFNQLYHNEGSGINALYVLSTLEGSLQLWWNNLPTSFMEHLNCLYAGTRIDHIETWYVFETCIHYNHVRASVQLPLLFNSILENKHAKVTSRSLQKLTKVAKENALLLSLMLRANPDVIFTNVFLVVLVFHITIPIYIASLIETSEEVKADLNQALEVHSNCVHQFLNMKTVKPLILDTFDYLLSLTDVKQLILDFTRFKILDQNPLAFKEYDNSSSFHLMFPNQLEMLKSPWNELESENNSTPKMTPSSEFNSTSEFVYTPSPDFISSPFDSLNNQ